jgi:hypothetical protein
MPDDSGLASIEEERAELQAMIEAMGRSSRLAQLLHYIGQKYFDGQSDQLSEYTIATEVFGRSKTSFDASEDAIARVEAHRLRKKLTEFYKGPGKGHTITIAIPPGTYAPTFTRQAHSSQASNSAESDGHTALAGALPASHSGGDSFSASGHNASAWEPQYCAPL